MFFIDTVRGWFRPRRNIYRYSDGHRLRYADPIRVGTRLEEVLPDYQDVLSELARDPNEAIRTLPKTTPDSVLAPLRKIRDDIVKQQRDAAVKLAAAARKVFDLPDLTPDGKGVSDGEAVGILTHYFLFMEELAGEAELFGDSPGTASPPHQPPATATESGAGSGTAGSGSSGDASTSG